MRADAAAITAPHKGIYKIPIEDNFFLNDIPNIIIKIPKTKAAVESRK